VVTKLWSLDSPPIIAAPFTHTSTTNCWGMYRLISHYLCNHERYEQTNLVELADDISYYF
jgi:hypothetical protein